MSQDTPSMRMVDLWQKSDVDSPWSRCVEFGGRATGPLGPGNNLRLIPLCLNTLAHPCGVALSPDEKNIYVGAQRFFRAKNIKKRLVHCWEIPQYFHPNWWNLVKEFNLGTDHPNLHPNFTRCVSIWEMMISLSWATTQHPSLYWSKRVRNLRHLSVFFERL